MSQTENIVQQIITNCKMFSANVTNRDPAEILLKNTADREFFLLFSSDSESTQEIQDSAHYMYCVLYGPAAVQYQVS
eukprot:COSAG01_NODE_1452_length_10260_cov_26.827970_12_plen_77_part_00